MGGDTIQELKMGQRIPNVKLKWWQDVVVMSSPGVGKGTFISNSTVSSFVNMVIVSTP